MHNLKFISSENIQLAENGIELKKKHCFACQFVSKEKKFIELDIKCMNSNRKKILIGMFKIRWSEDDIAHEHLYLVLTFIVEDLKIMIIILILNHLKENSRRVEI